MRKKLMDLFIAGRTKDGLDLFMGSELNEEDPSYSFLYIV